eukprot:gene6172-2786_t
MGKVLDMQQTLIDLVASLSTSNTSSVLGQVAREAKPLSTPVYSPPPASSSSQANSAPLTPLPNIPLGASLSDVLLSLGAAVQPPSTPSSASNAVRDAMAMVSSSSSADDADADLLALLAMSGKPPDMMYGDDDIYWMNHVHASLLHYGFYVDDQEVENWIFGDATTEAVMYFQSTHSLAETGIVDEETWEALFKDLPDTKKLIMDDIESGEVPNTTVNFPGAAPLVAPTATPKPTPMRSQNAVPSNFPSSSKIVCLLWGYRLRALAVSALGLKGTAIRILNTTVDFPGAAPLVAPTATPTPMPFQKAVPSNASTSSKIVMGL